MTKDQNVYVGGSTLGALTKCIYFFNAGVFVWPDEMLNAAILNLVVHGSRT